MINGIMKPRNCEKMALKVKKRRVTKVLTVSGRSCGISRPRARPRRIAMTIRPRRLILIRFM